MWFVSPMVWTTLYYILFGLMRLLVGLILNLWMGQLEQKIGELPFLLIGISRNLTNQLLICAPAAPMLTHSLWSEVSVCTTLLHHITLQFIVLYYERSSFIVQQINQIQFLELLCNRKVIVGCNVEELKINHLMMFCCTLDVCIEVDYSEPKVYTNLLWNS